MQYLCYPHALWLVDVVAIFAQLLSAVIDFVHCRAMTDYRRIRQSGVDAVPMSWMMALVKP